MDRGLFRMNLTSPGYITGDETKADKRIALTLGDSLFETDKFKYSTRIPDRDLNDFYRLKFTKYWWLNDTCPHIPELIVRHQLLLRPN